VTKKPSDEAHWSAPKLQNTSSASGGGTPGKVTRNILTGRLISSMSTKVFPKPQGKTFCINSNFWWTEVSLLRLVPSVFCCDSLGSSHVVMVIPMLTNTSKAKQTSMSQSLLSRASNLLSILFMSGISAGAYATIISWIQGYQYTSGSSHHQIMTHPSHQKTDNSCNHNSISLSVSQSGFPSRGVGSFFRTTSRPRESLGRAEEIFEKMKQLSHIFREKGIVTKDDYSPLPWSKGDQETFRRGALVRAETPKIERDRFRSWNSRRSYREHPYFSRNLKYVC
jgi:hypothetical protein